MLHFQCDFGIHLTSLTTGEQDSAPCFQAIFNVSSDIERICSVYLAKYKPIICSEVSGLNSSDWEDMLRSRHLYIVL